MQTKTVQIDGSGNAYLITPEGPDYIGSWNPSLRQFTFDDGDVWDVDPTTDIETFLVSFPTADEATDAESLMDHGELIDLAFGARQGSGRLAVPLFFIDFPEHETVALATLESNFPDWRKLVPNVAGSVDVETIQLGAEQLGRIAKVGKLYAKAPTIWYFSGPGIGGERGRGTDSRPAHALRCVREWRRRRRARRRRACTR